MALIVVLSRQRSARAIGNFVYHSTINYPMQLVMSCYSQGFLLSLRFACHDAWRVSPVLNKKHSKYLPVLPPLSSQ